MTHRGVEGRCRGRNNETQDIRVLPCPCMGMIFLSFLPFLNLFYALKNTEWSLKYVCHSAPFCGTECSLKSQ